MGLRLMRPTPSGDASQLLRLMCLTSPMRGMSVTEQRYQVVLGVLAEGRAVMEAASQWGVSRRTVHRWLARYEAAGLEGLPDRSHRPARCPHQMPAEIEVRVLELRRAHRQPRFVLASLRTNVSDHMFVIFRTLNGTWSDGAWANGCGLDYVRQLY